MPVMTMPTRRRIVASAAAGALARVAAPVQTLIAAPAVALIAVPAVAITRATELQVKAAFLYKFLAFIEWPPEAFERADAPIVIGTYGADPLADELRQMAAGRSVEGRPLALRRLFADVDPAGLHVVFVGRAYALRLARLAAVSKGRPLLIVTESEDGLSQGGAINFVIAEDKVRFEVAPAAVESRGLRVSARLLSVALKVKAGAP